MENIVCKLLEKSQEAFIMAIEIYNKPTLKYRVEGFSFFICNAWELLLKAYLMRKGESIYFKNNPKRTFSLEGCIKKVLTNKHDPLRENLEKIIELRNISTHYITEEYELIYIPLFQSCIINYTNKLLDYFNVDITDKLGSNFLTLSVKVADIKAADIKARYPSEIADKLLFTKMSVDRSIPSVGQEKYAIRVEHDWVLVKNPKQATASFNLSTDAKKSTYIMKEVIDPQKKYPFTTNRCIEFINRWIGKEEIPFVSPNRLEEKPGKFNNNHFQSFCKFYNLKENDAYTWQFALDPKHPRYSYSQKCIDFIKEEIKKDPEQIIQRLRDKLKK